jgi:uncharacterized membrane protein
LGSLINTDMTVIRRAWMRNLVVRENQFMDGQLLGQLLSSSSFLASSNLFLIAAAAGTLFRGEESYKSAASLVVIKMSSRALFEGQVGLIVLTLARGLLGFVCTIRQLNYCLATLGASPSKTRRTSTAEAYADAFARLLNPALSSFSAGVRGYYFAAAAAAWLFGPWAFIGATVAAVALLFWRQKLSPAAGAIASVRGHPGRGDGRRYPRRLESAGSVAVGAGRLARRHSLGGRRVSRRKRRAKCAWSAKPQDRAMCERGSWPPIISRRARSKRRQMMKACGVRPKVPLKAREK